MFKNSNPVLYGANGSTAYKYARSNDLEFKAKGSGDLSDELEALIQEEDEKGTSSGTWKNGTWEYNYDKTVLYINGTGELVAYHVHMALQYHGLPVLVARSSRLADYHVACLVYIGLKSVALAKLLEIVNHLFLTL